METLARLGHLCPQRESTSADAYGEDPVYQFDREIGLAFAAKRSKVAGAICGHLAGGVDAGEGGAVYQFWSLCANIPLFTALHFPEHQHA